MGPLSAEQKKAAAAGHGLLYLLILAQLILQRGERPVKS